jgi:excisionase family DNA binding protein
MSDWLTKQQAADAIGVSTKAIERFAHARKLEQASRPQARGPNVAVYNPDDVARLASERHPAPTPWVLPADADPRPRRNGTTPAEGLVPSSPPPLTTTLEGDPLRAFAVAVVAAVMSQTSETRPAPLFVTLDEAARVSGLSRGYIRRLIRDQKLPAVRCRGWRIRRRDLERL